MKPLSLEEKWAEVKEFYEAHYKDRFRAMPSEIQVEELYKKMGLMRSSLARFYFEEPALQRNYLQKKTGLGRLPIVDRESSAESRP